MPTPPKPFALLSSERKSHRTKEELEQRKKQEDALATKTAMTEWASVKNNPVAHSAFLRIRTLLRKIDKNDALFEYPINRYVQLFAECIDFEEKREVFYKRSKALDESFMSEENEMKPTDYYKLSAQLQAQVVSLDKQVQAKRKMMLDIEKENLMTIASALRAIPKKPVEDEQYDSMGQFIGRRNLIG